MTPKHCIEVQLSGRDGNAFSVIGAVVTALRRAGVKREEIEEFRKEATSGDYENVLQTCMKWVHVS
jgi:hypothetical protein